LIAAAEKIVSARRRFNGCEATARLSNQHASRVRYPASGRYSKDRQERVNLANVRK
jgi:hypothetical protein